MIVQLIVNKSESKNHFIKELVIFWAMNLSIQNKLSNKFGGIYIIKRCLALFNSIKKLLRNGSKIDLVIFIEEKM